MAGEVSGGGTRFDRTHMVYGVTTHTPRGEAVSPAKPLPSVQSLFLPPRCAELHRSGKCCFINGGLPTRSSS